MQKLENEKPVRPILIQDAIDQSSIPTNEIMSASADNKLAGDNTYNDPTVDVSGSTLEPTESSKQTTEGKAMERNDEYRATQNKNVSNRDTVEIIRGYLQTAFQYAQTVIGSSSRWIPTVATLIKLVLILIIINIVLKSMAISPTEIWRSVFEPEGFIFVDSPEVYTRERLINERLKEDIWLNEKLKEADDDENFVGLTRIIARQINLGNDSANRGEIDNVRDTHSSSRTVNDIASTNSNNDEKNNSISPNDLLTFEEKIRIKSATRDFILQKLIENRLDDRHDLQGNSLYILKFDTTVLSSRMSSKKAIVGIELVPPLDVTSLKLTDNLIASVLTKDESADILKLAFDQFMSDTQDRINRAMSSLETFPKVSSAEFKATIIHAAAQELGVVDSALNVVVEEYPFDNKTRKKVKLSSDAITNYFDFHTDLPEEEAPKLTEKESTSASPTFSSRQKGITIKALSNGCKKTTDEERKRTKRTYALTMSLNEVPDIVALKNLFSPLDDNLYLDTTIYGTHSLRKEQNRKNLLMLMNSALRDIDTSRAKITIQKPWGRIEFRRSVVGSNSNSSDSLERTNLDANVASSPQCVSMEVFLDLGFIHFAEKIAGYNNYSYSVLPRQSAVSVIDEVVESSTARLGLADKSGLNDQLGIGELSASNYSKKTGASLKSKISSFSYARQIGDKKDDSVVVGWVIDPSAGKASPRADELDSATESVLAIVSVPAWWPYLKLKIFKKWLLLDGSVEKASQKNDFISDDTETAVESSAEVRVNLPNTQQIIESTLINSDKRTPIISSSLCEFKNGAPLPGEPSKVICIVTGKRLWRNTVVTLDTTQNTSLSILPNMDGLIAEFPTPRDHCNGKLQVWTSEGVASVTISSCSGHAQPDIGR